MSDKVIECGQVWKANAKTKIYDFTDDYCIVLSKDKEYWKVGLFMIIDSAPTWGGAREHNLTDEELRENAEYSFSLRDVVSQLVSKKEAQVA